MDRNWSMAAASFLALGMSADPDDHSPRRSDGCEPEYRPPSKPKSNRKAALLEKSMRRASRQKDQPHDQ